MTFDAVGFGFAISTNISKNDPVAPSARNQLVDVAVTPALSWPAANGWPGRSRYIARSTMIGCVAVITPDTSVLASSGAALSTGTVVREFGGSVYDRTTGALPAGRRNVMVALAVAAFGFCSR